MGLNTFWELGAGKAGVGFLFSIQDAENVGFRAIFQKAGGLSRGVVGGKRLTVLAICCDSSGSTGRFHHRVARSRLKLNENPPLAWFRHRRR